MTAVVDLMFFLTSGRWLHCIKLQLQLSQSVSSDKRPCYNDLTLKWVHLTHFLFYCLSVLFPRGQDRKQRWNLLHLLHSFPQCADISSALMKLKRPGPHDSHTVPNTDASAWLGSMHPKEGHQWTESSIRHATPRPAPQTTVPSTLTATPTGFTTAHVISSGKCLIFLGVRVKLDKGANSSLL